MERLQKSKQKRSKLRSILCAKRIVLLSLMCLLLSTSAYGGESLFEETFDEEKLVDVFLTNAHEYGSVQLFSYLLTKVDSVVAVDPIQMHIETGNPDACRAHWRVKSRNGIALFVEQLLDIINELDPNKQNRVLYESPFIVYKGDLEQVKKAKSAVMTEGSVTFVIGHYPKKNANRRIWRQNLSLNPWFSLPGAGFD